MLYVPYDTGVGGGNDDRRRPPFASESKAVQCDSKTDFFSKAFSLCPECRLRADAFHHPYLAPIAELMTRDLAAAEPPREGEQMLALSCC